MNPSMKVGVQKKLKKLYFSYDEDTALELDIVDGEIDLIQLDEWITGILTKEYEKVKLRTRLSGG